jgi:N-dimethylarginine dimethylaminohydrolase
MMGSPDHFEVSYTINPWMDPAQWSVSADRLAGDARRGWAALKAMYERLGARVWTQPAVRGLPDMVFTANSAVVLDRKVLLARFLCPERQGEERHNRAWFEALRARGQVDEIVEPPPGLFFEGAGDAIWDPARRLMWTAYGQRSSRAMHAVIEQLYGVPTMPLELVDPRFYHLDTCLCPLEGGWLLYYPAAFDPASQRKIRALVPEERRIEVGEADAEKFACNAVNVGRHVILNDASLELQATLRRAGFTPLLTPLTEFLKSGGAAKCLTLKLIE